MKIEQLFEDEPQKSIVFLLTIFQDGLEQKEIFSTLATKEKLEELLNKKEPYNKKTPDSEKISYDYKRERDKIKKEFEGKKNEFVNLFDKISIGCITSKNQLNRILGRMRDELNALTNDNRRWKLSDEILRLSMGKMHDELIKSSILKFPFSKKSKLIEREKQLKNIYSKIISDYSEEEKIALYDYVNSLKTDIDKLMYIISSKIQKEWREHLGILNKHTSSMTIKDAMKNSAMDFYQLINVPYCQIELLGKRTMINEDIHISTMVFFLIHSLEKYHNKMESNPKIKTYDIMTGEINPKITKKFSKDIAHMNYFITEISQGINKNLKIKKDHILSMPIDKYSSKLEKYLELFDYKDFCKTWSECFFHRHYDFSVNDILEISYFSSISVDTIRKLYSYTDIIPKGTVSYISQMYLALKKDIPFKRFIGFKPV